MIICLLVIGSSFAKTYIIPIGINTGIGNGTTGNITNFWKETSISMIGTSLQFLVPINSSNGVMIPDNTFLRIGNRAISYGAFIHNGSDDAVHYRGSTLIYDVPFSTNSYYLTTPELSNYLYITNNGTELPNDMSIVSSTDFSLKPDLSDDTYKADIGFLGHNWNDVYLNDGINFYEYHNYSSVDIQDTIRVNDHNGLDINSTNNDINLNVEKSQSINIKGGLTVNGNAGIDITVSIYTSPFTPPCTMSFDKGVLYATTC